MLVVDKSLYNMLVCVSVIDQMMQWFSKHNYTSTCCRLMQPSCSSLALSFRAWVCSFSGHRLSLGLTHFTSKLSHQWHTCIRLMM